MGWVRRAGRRGVREEPALVRPLRAHRLQPDGYGPGVVRTHRRWFGGELPGGHVDVWSGGHGEVLRGSRGDAAGTELGSSFVERIVSEHGNRLGPRPAAVLPARVTGLGPPSTDRVGTGRSRRSTPSRGEPAHMGKGGSDYEKGWTL